MAAKTVIFALVAGLTALSGCTSTDCDTQQDAGGQQVVCNGPTFTYTLQGSRSLETDQYSWESRGEKAWANAVFQGTGTVYLTIKDHNGKQVYSKQHSGSGQTVGSQATESGEPGTWTIKIETRGLQGQVVVTVSPRQP